eukprot:3210586-Ditylum_brightwellii.AAC.1
MVPKADKESVTLALVLHSWVSGCEMYCWHKFTAVRALPSTFKRGGEIEAPSCHKEYGALFSIVPVCWGNHVLKVGNFSTNDAHPIMHPVHYALVEL